MMIVAAQGKVRDLLAPVLGLDFSVGTVPQAPGKVALALAAPLLEAANTLSQNPVVHMDETRYPREGSTGQWVRGVVTPKMGGSTCCPRGHAT